MPRQGPYRTGSVKTVCSQDWYSAKSVSQDWHSVKTVRLGLAGVSVLTGLSTQQTAENRTEVAK